LLYTVVCRSDFRDFQLLPFKPRITVGIYFTFTFVMFTCILYTQLKLILDKKRAHFIGTLKYVQTVHLFQTLNKHLNINKCTIMGGGIDKQLK